MCVCINRERQTEAGLLVEDEGGRQRRQVSTGACGQERMNLVISFTAL